MSLHRIFSKSWRWLIFIICLVFSLFYAKPILIAFLTALCFNPLIIRYEKKWNKTRRFIVPVFFSIFSIVVLFFCYLLYLIVLHKFSDFSHWIPHLLETINERWIYFQAKLANITHDLPRPIIISIQQWIEDMLNSLQKIATTYFQANYLLNLFQKFPSAIFKMFIYFLALYYAMLEIPKITKSLSRWLHIEKNPSVTVFLQHFKKGTLEFLKAQLIVSVIIFSVTLCTLLWITPRYALPMAIVIWFVDLLPILGAMMVLIPWAIISWMSGQNFEGTILFILAIVVIVLRQILETKVTSNHLGLPPLTTLICMYVGFEMFGIIGFFIGPFVAILIVVIGQFRKSWTAFKRKN
ncbi:MULTISPECIES: sporulation integral membrane protein YtvI [unclassified Rummeliibacillus]|uniref:sporulation integral membrane protein YtvI n=1 Tax=unclassified Rummeliibacillus TaxID=2622809 RepID=UPI000E6609C4|nr:MULTISPECIES: sporulation integral membrane protein YtvI [unclassified Rummeliibacillus]RIJ69134.1 sporulation integral membrane protein YtvI [Rummeliibacillus sp. POC4]RPJ94380.1 sporulation integral membrane protein YtvI [Rummeliibacillus sp. TYF005]